ncbi:MAG TPA: tetratricopeptide repeat protein [Candidatus Polarisedimenticolaceae bacterium]|nr:tetratricopeptide repeat protein [Candidatus Polarisedimenticolaceae bacterium]
MLRRAFPAVGALALLFAASPAGAITSTPKPKSLSKPVPTDSFERPDAQALVREAKALWHIEKDYNGALAKFNAAVDASPDDSDVRLQRGHFFEVLAALVVPEDREKFKEFAQEDYQSIAEGDPDSLIAGVARDGMTRLAGEEFLEVKTVECPETAIEIHSRGESLYGARRYSDAIAAYEKATAGCPEAAAWWVDFADSHYVVEDYRKAKELFSKALTVDPWNREAHRFLADTDLQLGDNEAAVHELVLTVVSDPMYEAGWSALRLYGTALGHKWKRVFGNRNVEPRGADAAAWVAYINAKADAADGKSALAVERAAVKRALAAARETEPGPSRVTSPFWAMIERADQAGYLDEAIFLHLFDAALAGEYPEFREKHSQRLSRYVETLIME